MQSLLDFPSANPQALKNLDTYKAEGLKRDPAEADQARYFDRVII